MPTDFGRPFINIQKYYSSFKAAEWCNWIILYSIPLLHKYPSKKYLNGWSNFVKATKLCLNQILSKDELKEIKILFIKFIKHYE
ncbi:5916_t:CDS:2, partial [Cetraspora pellucida]